MCECSWYRSVSPVLHDYRKCEWEFCGVSVFVSVPTGECHSLCVGPITLCVCVPESRWMHVSLSGSSPTVTGYG